jgi:LEA14-like dessication related protein
MNKKYWALLVGIIVYIGYKKYVLTQSLNIFFKSLDFSNLSLIDPTLNLVVQANNPTSTSADLQNIRGELYIDDVLVGNVFGITPVSIAPGSSIINIPVTISYAGAGDLVQKFSSNNFKLNFKGTMNVDFITIPLNFDYSF